MLPSQFFGEELRDLFCFYLAAIAQKITRIMPNNKHPASFRDPSGHIFVENKQVYRQINASYFTKFDMLTATGLYETLINNGWLVPHEIVEKKKTI